MANYVWNKVVCSKEVLDRYFIDPDPFGDGVPLEDPYISFNKLFGVKSLDEYSQKIGVHISYGFSFSWNEQEDGLYEVKFCTRWEYPIRAIVRAIELSHDTVWYAVEENHVYASKFYWENGVKEDVILIEDEYDQWCDKNMDFEESLEDPDDWVWYFLPTVVKPWRNWKSDELFTRYLDVSAVDVSYPFVVDREKIHNFAVKYHRLYVNPQTSEREVEDGFAEQCSALGFEPDFGNKFMEAFCKCEALDDIIDGVDDAELLGSAILAHWSYVTHLTDDSSLLDEERRPWFIDAFARLAVITEEEGRSTFIFEGELWKIRLISNNICYGQCPKPEDEVEQHLTVTADGRVRLSRYRFGAGEAGREPIEKLTFDIPKENADEIMAAMTSRFGSEYSIDFVQDVGSWDLMLTNTEGRIYKVTGSLYKDIQTPSGGLSELLRLKIGRDDLFAFDGNRDLVDRIEIKYHRTTKIKTDVMPKGTASEYATWNYKEQLIIDRKSQTMEHIKETGSGCKVTAAYYVEEGIRNFLDSLDTDIFSNIEGNPPDVIDDPMNVKEYMITITTKRGDIRTVSGSFDRDGLPTDWPELIEDVYHFMIFYGFGEIFNKNVYGKARRRQYDLIFCNVEFEHEGSTYCYLADSDEYDEGDLVVVPVGPNNREAVARIESVEYHPPEEAPFPLQKTKHILRRYKDGRGKSKGRA